MKKVKYSLTNNECRKINSTPRKSYLTEKNNSIRKHTSPWLLGIIVAFAIFRSTKSRIPVLSSDALINVPELLPMKV